MNTKATSPNKFFIHLFSIGASLVAIGGIGWVFYPRYTGWIISCGGLLMAISFVLSAFNSQKETVRARRLERMKFISSLLYLVSGGFMIQESSYWLPLYIIGTLFFVYSAFIKDQKSSN